MALTSASEVLRRVFDAATGALKMQLSAGALNIGDVDVLTIAAGDNNIGNVDVVTLPALAAGSALIGKVGIDQTTPGTTDRVTVGGITYNLTSSPTLSAPGAYASGDYVGPSTTPATLSNAVRTSGGTAVLQSLVLVDKALQSLALELWLFDRTFTAPTDNAAWSISDADALNCLGAISIAAGDYKASALNSVATITNIGLVLKPNATSLFYAIVARSAPTYADGDLQLRFGLLVD